jgi:hypothetical protein
VVNPSYESKTSDTYPIDPIDKSKSIDLEDIGYSYFSLKGDSSDDSLQGIGLVEQFCCKVGSGKVFDGPSLRTQAFACVPHEHA